MEFDAGDEDGRGCGGGCGLEKVGGDVEFIYDLLVVVLISFKRKAISNE